MPLPVSVIIPTRNCRKELVDHLAAMQTQLTEVAQVIGVDGSSTDGTCEILRKFCAGHPGGQFIAFPPGLYAGWNAGVAEASQPSIYFSTVGDYASEGALGKLSATAERLSVDVLITPPRMIGEEEELTPHRCKWPVHYLTEAMPPGSCRVLSMEETVLSMTSFVPGTILGSSASNFYRTEFLKEHPFPVAYGHAGDTAWGIENCLVARVGIFAETLADFRLGWKFTETDARLQKDTYQRLVALAASVLSRDDVSELRFLRGWFGALADNKLGLWEWLASQADLAQQHEGAIAKIGELSAEMQRRVPERIFRTVMRAIQPR